MRIPWGTPTVSDSTKIKPVPLWRRWNSTAPYIPSLAGGRLYELYPQVVATDDFADLDDWTVTDSGSNVSVSGNECSINGSGAWNANGIRRVHDLSTFKPCFMEIELFNVYCGGAAPAADQMSAGAHTADTLTTDNRGGYWRNQGSTYSALGGYASSYRCSWYPDDRTYWRKFRFFWLPSMTGAAYRRVRVTVEDSEIGEEVEIGEFDLMDSVNVANFCPQFQRYTNRSEAPLKLRNYKWAYGLPTDGPTVTFVADAGDGKAFDNFDPSALAAVGAWATTNAKFKWSFDDGTPAYNASWLTLAQLQAEGKQTGRHRYIRLQIQLNSDGATQQYGGELQSDTGTDGSGDFPAVADVHLSATVQGSAGTLTTPALALQAWAEDVDEALKASFDVGATVYVAGNLQFVKALADAEVLVLVVDLATLAPVAVLMDEVTDFSAGVLKTIAEINGGSRPTWTAIAGEYGIALSVFHDDLPGGLRGTLYGVNGGSSGGTVRRGAYGKRAAAY